VGQQPKKVTVGFKKLAGVQKVSVGQQPKKTYRGVQKLTVGFKKLAWGLKS